MVSDIVNLKQNNLRTQNTSNMHKKITKCEREKYKKWSHHKYATPEDERDKYASLTTKACSKCKQVKFLTEFNGNSSGRDPFDKEGYRLRRPECSTCSRRAGKGKNAAKQIAKTQNIPYKAPKGTCCAICGKAKNKMVFDHCHEKEIFRGYLCDPCNRSMGVLGDNIEGLIRCINYLQTTENRKIIQEENGHLRIVDEASSQKEGESNVPDSAATTF